MGRPSLRSRARVASDKGPTDGKPKRQLTTSQASNLVTKPHNKQEKRDTKQAQLLAKARDSSKATGRHGSGIKKRRRPARKLAGTDAAGLQKLANALDDILPASDRAGMKAVSESSMNSKQMRLAPTLAIKSRPGMQRKKENVNRLESQRFSRNLAILNAAKPSSKDQTQQSPAMRDEETRSKRWEALRQHISSTMQKG